MASNVPTIAASSSRGHSSIAPDTTVITVLQEQGTMSSTSQQTSKMKPGQSPSLPLSSSVNSPRHLPMPATASSHTVAPPMTMLSPFMTDYKGGQTGAESLSLSGYIELMTLVKL